MDAVTTLLWSIGLTTALAGSIVLLLAGPFLRLLVDLCGSPTRGKFWFVFACVSIVLTTLLGALSSFPPGFLTAWRENSALEFLVASVRSGLLGLLLSLAAVALALVVSIGRRAPASEPPVVRT